MDAWSGPDYSLTWSCQEKKATHRHTHRRRSRYPSHAIISRKERSRKSMQIDSIAYQAGQRVRTRRIQTNSKDIQPWILPLLPSMLNFHVSHLVWFGSPGHRKVHQLWMGFLSFSPKFRIPSCTACVHLSHLISLHGIESGRPTQPATQPKPIMYFATHKRQIYHLNHENHIAPFCLTHTNPLILYPLCSPPPSQHHARPEPNAPPKQPTNIQPTYLLKYAQRWW